MGEDDLSCQVRFKTALPFCKSLRLKKEKKDIAAEGGYESRILY